MPIQFLMGEIVLHAPDRRSASRNMSTARRMAPSRSAPRTHGLAAILPLVPHLDTLRWLFIALALGGIAVTIYARLDDWRRGRR